MNTKVSALYVMQLCLMKIPTVSLPKSLTGVKQRQSLSFLTKAEKIISILLTFFANYSINVSVHHSVYHRQSVVPDKNMLDGSGQEMYQRCYLHREND